MGPIAEKFGNTGETVAYRCAMENGSGEQAESYGTVVLGGGGGVGVQLPDEPVDSLGRMTVWGSSVSPMGEDIIELAKIRIAKAEQHKTHRQILSEAMPEDWHETVKLVLAYDYASNWEEGWPDVPEWEIAEHADKLGGDPLTVVGWKAAGVEHLMRIQPGLL